MQVRKNLKKAQWANLQAKIFASACAFLELSKPRICLLVTFTTICGFILSSGNALSAKTLILTALGVLLSAGGVNALNQFMERKRDALMERTAKRPLPSRRISEISAIIFGVALSLLGPAVVFIFANPLASSLTVLTEFIYLFIYTPLKPITSLSTLAGALVGAIPPMIGWAGATGTLHKHAFLLASLLFIWQIPHFLSLAYAYREDYQKAGFKFLPIIDRDGRLTAEMVALYGLALTAPNLALALGLADRWIWVGFSFLISVAFAYLCFRFLFDRTVASARRIFRASLVYLPLMLVLLLAGNQKANTESKLALGEVQTRLESPRLTIFLSLSPLKDGHSYPSDSRLFILEDGHSCPSVSRLFILEDGHSCPSVSRLFILEDGHSCPSDSRLFILEDGHSCPSVCVRRMRDRNVPPPR